MKLLLLPITFVSWVLLVYFSIYLSAVVSVYLIALPWIWSILLFMFLSAIINLSIRLLLKVNLYNIIAYNKYVMALHTIAGILGVISGIISIGLMNIPFQAFWDYSWFKLLIVAFFAFSIIRFVIVIGISLPFTLSDVYEND